MGFFSNVGNAFRGVGKRLVRGAASFGKGVYEGGRSIGKGIVRLAPKIADGARFVSNLVKKAEPLFPIIAGIAPEGAAFLNGVSGVNNVVSGALDKFDKLRDIKHGMSAAPVMDSDKLAAVIQNGPKALGQNASQMLADEKKQKSAKQMEKDQYQASLVGYAAGNDMIPPVKPFIKESDGGLSSEPSVRERLDALQRMDSSA